MQDHQQRLLCEEYEAKPMKNQASIYHLLKERDFLEAERDELLKEKDELEAQRQFLAEMLCTKEEVWERERRMLIFSLVDRNQASGDLRCQEAPALALFDADVERLAQRAVGQSDPPFLPERFFSTAGPAACNEGATGIESPDVALIHRLNEALEDVTNRFEIALILQANQPFDSSAHQHCCNGTSRKRLTNVWAAVATRHSALGHAKPRGLSTSLLCSRQHDDGEDDQKDDDSSVISTDDSSFIQAPQGFAARDDANVPLSEIVNRRSSSREKERKMARMGGWGGGVSEGEMLLMRLKDIHRGMQQI